MKIHLRQLPPGSSKWEGEEDAAPLGLGDVEAVPLGPLIYCLEVGVSRDGLFATGSLILNVQLQCVACLRFFEYKVQIENFAIQVELTGRESVDLTPFVREDILLALPSYPRCDSTTNLSCPATFPTDVKPVEGEQGAPLAAWEALKNLKPKKNS